VIVVVRTKPVADAARDKAATLSLSGMSRMTNTSSSPKL
jgi:hypothetical protein